MADEKEYDPDKTLEEERGDDLDRAVPGSERPPEEEGTRPPTAPSQPGAEEPTVIAPRPTAGPPTSHEHDAGAFSPNAGDDERTVIAESPPSIQREPQDDPRTVLRRSDAEGGADRRDDTAETQVRVSEPISSAAPPVAPGSGYELVGLSAETRGQRFAIPAVGGAIGSNPSCDISIPGTEGIHAKIEPFGDGFLLRNLSPGKTLAEKGRGGSDIPIQSGELLKLNDVVLRIVKEGEVFSSEYSEDAFKGSILERATDLQFWKENPLYAVGAGLVVVLLLLVIVPRARFAGTTAGTDTQTAAAAKRGQEISALLAAAEILFAEGNLIAPQEQPNAESAYGKFNAVLEIDPGNEEAIAGLRRIDEARGSVFRERTHAVQTKVAAEQTKVAAERTKTAGEADEIVARLLGEGDELYFAGQILEPAGQNALERYQEAIRANPENAAAQERLSIIVNEFIRRGDEARANDLPWDALENYRKASRVSEGRESQVESRVREVEDRLRSKMAGAQSYIVMYADENQRLTIVDDPKSVPARYRDRSVEVRPAPEAAP